MACIFARFCGTSVEFLSLIHAPCEAYSRLLSDAGERVVKKLKKPPSRHIKTCVDIIPQVREQLSRTSGCLAHLSMRYQCPGVGTHSFFIPFSAQRYSGSLRDRTKSVPYFQTEIMGDHLINIFYISVVPLAVRVSPQSTICAFEKQRSRAIDRPSLSTAILVRLMMLTSQIDI